MSAPLLPAGSSEAVGGLAVSLAIGLGFGFVLERAGFGSARRLAAQFYLHDMTVLTVMFTAIVTAMVGIFALRRLGWLDLDLLWVNPTYLWPQIAGGLLLGVGFIVSGYCPGTSIVAAASGRIDGLLALGGVFAGIGAYAAASVPALEAFQRSGDRGRLLLCDGLGVDPSVAVIGAVAMAGAAFAGAEAIERRIARGRSDSRAAPSPSRDARLWTTGAARPGSRAAPGRLRGLGARDPDTARPAGGGDARVDRGIPGAGRDRLLLHRLRRRRPAGPGGRSPSGSRRRHAPARPGGRGVFVTSDRRGTAPAPGVSVPATPW